MSLFIVMAFWGTPSISPSTLPPSFPYFLPYFKNKHPAPKIEKSFFVAPAFSLRTVCVFPLVSSWHL